MGAPVTSVDFHFDIMCPWAFQASVWMRDVRDRLGLEVRWRFFSLEEVNRAEDGIRSALGQSYTAIEAGPG